MDNSEALNNTAAGLKACGRSLHPVLALVAGACLLALVGWTGAVSAGLHWATALTGIAFAIERGVGFLSHRAPVRSGRVRWFYGLLAAGVFCVSAALLLQPAEQDGWSMGGHVFVLLSVLVSGIASVIAHQTRFTARAFHPGQVVMLSFLSIVLLGMLLLKMPRCMEVGRSCTWLEALFTSTSAVCVTGLTVLNTATDFSTTGQVVILCLIQVGGLGIMTLTFFAAVVLFEGLSLHDRILLGKMIQENRLARIGETLAFIVAVTFISEAAGALVLYAGMDGVADLSTRWFHAVFHSVSAFCNAGFSTLPNNMADGLVTGNALWQTVIMSLIIIGGLGPLVIEDLSLWAQAKVRRWIRKEGPRPRLRVHTRLVLVVSALLVSCGAAAVYVTEFHLWNGPENGGRALTALFHSVTARTAGFNSVTMSEIGPLTAQMIIILMIVGGSPGGTAGGIRTTVAAVAVAHLWSQLRMGQRGMVFFNRTIPAATGSQALGLVFLTGMWLVANFIILQALQAGSGISESALLFELISAFATVGLSLDLTPALGDGAKTLLIVNMFVGRIGLLTVMATLIRPDKRSASGKPSENILLT